MINIFIQARMSSKRFPGKMLADFKGKPLIDHVVERCAAASGVDQVVVLTSAESSDDLLAMHVEKEGHRVFRGDLDNVFLRFQKAAQEYPCDAFVRINGDSPLIAPELITHMIKTANENGCDFLSNVKEKTFPKGQSIELIKTDIFQSVDASSLTPEQAEHVMPYFYEHTADYVCCFPALKNSMRHLNMCVDVPEDIKRLSSEEIEYRFKAEDICQDQL